MKLSKPFIRLPFNFDVERLRQEVANIPNSARMPHPSGAKGNSSVPLISVDGANNDLFHGAMAITPHLQQSPYMMQVLAHFGEVLTRSRLMLLGPWAKVPRHVDSRKSVV